MAQSDQERISQLENQLASLCYRLEDMEKEIKQKLEVMSILVGIKVQSATMNKEQPKYEGESCSCSPMGMPHSINCKGYFSGPSYEDMRDKITRYEKL